MLRVVAARDGGRRGIRGVGVVEDEVVGREGLAVVPLHAALQLPGDGAPVLRDGAVLERRHFRRQHRDEVRLGVPARERLVEDAASPAGPWCRRRNAGSAASAPARTASSGVRRRRPSSACSGARALRPGDAAMGQHHAGHRDREPERQHAAHEVAAGKAAILHLSIRPSSCLESIPYSPKTTKTRCSTGSPSAASRGPGNALGRPARGIGGKPMAPKQDRGDPIG